MNKEKTEKRANEVFSYQPKKDTSNNTKELNPKSRNNNAKESDKL